MRWLEEEEEEEEVSQTVSVNLTFQQVEVSYVYNSMKSGTVEVHIMRVRVDDEFFNV